MEFHIVDILILIIQKVICVGHAVKPDTGKLNVVTQLKLLRYQELLTKNEQWFDAMFVIVGVRGHTLGHVTNAGCVTNAVTRLIIVKHT